MTCGLRSLQSTPVRAKPRRPPAPNWLAYCSYRVDSQDMANQSAAQLRRQPVQRRDKGAEQTFSRLRRPHAPSLAAALVEMLLGHGDDGE